MLAVSVCLFRVSGYEFRISGMFSSCQDKEIKQENGYGNLKLFRQLELAWVAG